MGHKIKLFNYLGYILDLRLPESEEAGAIKILRSVPAEYLGHTRDMVRNAYRLKNEVNVALEIARSETKWPAMNGQQALESTNDLDLWEKAYKIAQASDDAAQPLLDGQLHCLIIVGGLSLGWILPTILTIIHMRKNAGIRHQYDLDSMVLMIAYWALPSIIFIVLPLFCSKQLTALLVPLSTDAILDAALTANVKLDIRYLIKKELSTGDMLADSSSLIGQLLNSTGNLDDVCEGEKIDVPNAFICPINLQIMTDPVYSEQSPQRFERTALLNWLKLKLIHPLAMRPLSPNHLKRDFDLKRAIMLFVDNKSKTAEIKPAKDALVSLSMFQSKPQCLTDDDDITDEMIYK